MKRSIVLGAGKYLPECRITNDDLTRWMDTTDEWIQQRTGVKSRHFATEGEGVADMCANAARDALKMANMEAKDLEFIILATLSPDYAMPGSGVLVQKYLGCETIGALDVRNQCSGFIYSLSVADQFIRSGMYKNVLVLGGESHSSGLDLSTRGRDISAMFGDGAGAVILGAVDVEEGEEAGILTTHLHSEGHFLRSLWCEQPGSIFRPRMTPEIFNNDRWFPKMKGRFVFTHALRRFPEVMNEALEASGYKVDDLDLFIPHQANLRIIEFVARQIEIPMEKVFTNIQKYGNTTAGTLPICITEAIEENRLKDDDLLLIASFGAGFTWGSVLMRWKTPPALRG
jgi:3-oxoacyl-[acyl-carrier-protein] synthase III